jgi:hypothetical protein
MRMRKNHSDFVFAVSPLSRKDIEADATTILGRFVPSLLREPGPFDVVHFFDHTLRDVYKLDTAVQHLEDGVEGQAWPDGRVFVSENTYNMACLKDGRGRYTIAHECYHGIKHRSQIRNVLVHTGQATLYRRHSLPAYRDPEWQADYFAACVLMPAPMVGLLANRVANGQIVQSIVETFQVSWTAARIRAEQVLALKVATY